jgi:purine-binding chemotaxis protein CheW
MQIEEILVIKNGSESYGISTSDINQISRVPALMPFPLRPFGVRGLCAVSGDIVNMIDINLLLDTSQVDYESDASRLLTLNGAHSSNAILVSNVQNTLELNKKNIEFVDKEDDPVIAIYKHEGKLIQIISLDILISKISKISIAPKEVKSADVKTKPVQEEDENKFLIFSLGDEKYALNIEYLLEIVLADVDITEIANSSQEVVGLMTLREELLLVIDLRTYYGFKKKNSHKNRILITSFEGKKTALLIDEIIDIKCYLSKQLEYMGESSKDSKISGVIHEDGYLISFFDRSVLEQIYNENDTFIDDKSSDIDTYANVEYVMEVIIFKLSDKEYAFEVDNVSEIIDSMDFTKVVYSDESVDGIINIRGEIITIVSLHKKLGIEPLNKATKIIICTIDKMKIGFLVDSVSDIINIKIDEAIEHDDKLFTHMLYLNDGERLVLSMDIDEVVRKFDE